MGTPLISQATPALFPMRGKPFWVEDGSGFKTLSCIWFVYRQRKAPVQMNWTGAF